MKKIIVFFLFAILLFSNRVALTQGIHWKNAPSVGFVYEISNKEAQKLLSTAFPDTLCKEFLHTLIDTFNVEKGWTDRPSKGHFILVRIIEDRLHCEYTCALPYQVFLFKAYDAFALQVLDLEGNVRDDAIVKIRNKKLKIDQESKTYRLENEWFKGNNQLVTVELNDFKSFFDIEKYNVPSWYHDYGYDEGPSFYSYMITDKNKYKPNENVRFKSYALSNVKTPLRKELEIWLTSYSKSIKVGSVAPHRPGSYAGEFQLHDSLKLVLDKDYYLQLREKNSRIVADCRFKYEDYELFGNKLEVQLSKPEQFYPETNELIITATDANGLILKDAKANILVKTNSILETFQPFVILPDTLKFLKLDLDPVQPTRIQIPSDLFQKTNTSYEALVEVRNSQNQLLTSRVMATFNYSRYEITTHFSNDSICFDLLKNDKPEEKIAVELRYDKELHGKEIRLPYKEKLNPAIILYTLENEQVNKQFTLSHLSPKLELTGGILKDSFNIHLQNPQLIDISWYVYQGSKLLKKGFGKEVDYEFLIEDRSQTIYVELLYSFGGEDHIYRKQYEFREDFLNVSLDIPDRIYPGQEVDATILVSNQLGKPIRGVDLTAWAVTGKLNYYLPDLPYYGTSSTARPKSAYYDKRDRNYYKTSFVMDYKKWNALARLDTMLYYQFTYPLSGMFKYPVDISDSTQFAPYVMQNGRAKQVYVIEVNHMPVYFSWADKPGDYSFFISPSGKQQISLRLFDSVLILDSLSFEEGKKTILSIDLDHLPAKTQVIYLGTSFTSTETSRYIWYIAEFRNYNADYAYLEFMKEFTPLFSKKNERYGRSIVAGPVTSDIKTYVDDDGTRTTYRHQGGFGYYFEDNIVYKMNSSIILPAYLTDIDYNPLININDSVMTKKHFLDLQAQEEPPVKWHPRVIDIIDPGLCLKVFLPYETEASGIADMLFENCTTKDIIVPCYFNYYSERYDFYEIRAGHYNAIVLYNNGTYLKMDSIYLRQNAHAAVDLNQFSQHSSDNVSQQWLTLHSASNNDCYKTSNKSDINYTAYSLRNTEGNITGAVYDKNNTPLPGVNILIKGTASGTITDLDGRFSLRIDNYSAVLYVSYIGFLSEEIEVIRGSEVIVQMTEDIVALDEVVVVGYGTQKRSDLTGATSSIGGMMEAPPDDEEDTQEDKIIQDSEQQLYQELLSLNSIRSNFSDVGFWEPRLFTDKQGRSQFSVTFPDDITQWNATVYAMNRYLQTGTTRKYIKSYKPLMAELHVPQFLTCGDSALFLGKVLNYTSDSIIQGKVNWKGARTDFEKDIRFTQFHTDFLPVAAISTDSITTSYTFTRDDGYMDGEERTVPIVEQGIVRADGTLSILKNKENRHIKAIAGKPVTIEMLSNQIDIYAGEVKYLLSYKYACNEQLASKLIGLINYKMIMQFEGKPFKYDKDVNTIIGRLLKNQNKEFLWSWWDVSNNTSYWISGHILRALKFAKDAGYTVDLNIANLTSKAEYKFIYQQQYSLQDIDLVHSIAQWGSEINYGKHLAVLDSLVLEKEKEEAEAAKDIRHYRPYSMLNEKLLLMEIRQITGLPYQRDSLMKYRRDGIMGEIYFSDNKLCRYWYHDDMANNVVAYRIIKNDSLLCDLLVPMQMYFLSTRKNGSWNTYQSSNVMMNVLPDLMAEGYSKEQASSVTLTGKVNENVTKFPYQVTLQPEEELNIQKESGLPLYYMQYVHERVTSARTGVQGFKITTYFSNNSNVLKAGEPVDLIVDVTVTKETLLEHVMIEVPIPGACSYLDKRQILDGIETHREYFKDRTVIFCDDLRTGGYTFVIRLLPRFTGKYILNPAQVSLMYIPVVNANTNLKKLKVE